MKISFARFFLLLICLCVLAPTTVAQEKRQALKFDEFDDFTTNQFYSYYSHKNELNFTQRVERFIQQLKKERSVKAYIIYYKARINNSDVQRNFINRIDGIRSEIQYKDGIETKEVIVINGGYRERNTVEFWIVPKDVELPEPKPIFDKWETFVCPDINVYSNIRIGEPETINFSFSTRDFPDPNNYSPTWKVSVGGEITDGQGTNEILIKLKNSAVKQLTAYVEISGVPYPCQKVFSATAEIKGKLHLVDVFGQANNGEIKARLDNFFVILQNNPTAQGYIIVYGNRAVGERDVVRRTTLIKNQIVFRGLDVSRVTFIRGGFREEISTEFWLSFDDAEKPVPTPTVDEKFVVTPKPAGKPRLRKR